MLVTGSGFYNSCKLNMTCVTVIVRCEGTCYQDHTLLTAHVSVYKAVVGRTHVAVFVKTLSLTNIHLINS